MNFCAAVLLVVMQHGEPGPTAAAGPTAHDPSAQEDPHASSEPAVELRRVASGGSDGEGPVGFEELAFWTFAAMMERLMPADFYQARPRGRGALTPRRARQPRRSTLRCKPRCTPSTPALAPRSCRRWRACSAMCACSSS
eukprot:6455618-Prymnesium_polylepis.1